VLLPEWLQEREHWVSRRTYISDAALSDAASTGLLCRSAAVTEREITRALVVQAWLGHASIATTKIYLHHLGSSAHPGRTGPSERLGGTGGSHDAGNAE
jgi:hypothetical protein